MNPFEVPSADEVHRRLTGATLQPVIPAGGVPRNVVPVAASGSDAPAAPPDKQVHSKVSSLALDRSKCIIVNECQRGNAVIEHIRRVPIAYTTDTKYDYVMGTSAALFLSLRFHGMHPDYIHQRLNQTRNAASRLKVLLILIDVKNSSQALTDLAAAAIVHGYTLISTWTTEEAALYLESYKVLEKQSAEAIKAPLANLTFRDRAINLFKTIRGVTKSNAEDLLNTFGTLAAVAQASEDALACVAGIGPTRARAIHAAFSARLLPPPDDDISGEKDPKHGPEETGENGERSDGNQPP